MAGLGRRDPGQRDRPAGSLPRLATTECRRLLAHRRRHRTAGREHAAASPRPGRSCTERRSAASSPEAMPASPIAWRSDHDRASDVGAPGMNSRIAQLRPSMSEDTQPIKVDIWSDIACPWCYIGKRKFETAGRRVRRRGRGRVPQLRAAAGHPGRLRWDARSSSSCRSKGCRSSRCSRCSSG